MFVYNIVYGGGLRLANDYHGDHHGPLPNNALETNDQHHPSHIPTGTEQSLTDRLRHDIVAGNLVPHQRLVEADVAEEHQASRGDVRLALNELITEGLVERIPNRGARVRKVSLQEAIEITEVRGAVESL